jgi:hypothetical protein
VRLVCVLSFAAQGLTCRASRAGMAWLVTHNGRNQKRALGRGVSGSEALAPDGAFAAGGSFTDGGHTKKASPLSVKGRQIAASSPPQEATASSTHGRGRAPAAVLLRSTSPVPHRLNRWLECCVLPHQLAPGYSLLHCSIALHSPPVPPTPALARRPTSTPI